MKFYKILQNNNVVGVGCNFLQWSRKSKKFIICNMEQAMAILDNISETIYHSDWLFDIPLEADIVVQEAEIVLINRSEYDELYELLSDGEEIPVPEPEPEPTPEPTPEPEPEHRMTIQEMRERIAELTELVMSESTDFTAGKDYQSGDLIQNGSRVYIASQVIIKGETVSPGINCIETTIAEVYNQIQKGE